MSAESGPDDHRGDGERPSMYYPQGLSTQETELLKTLRHEAAWKRGYPYALFLGGTALFASRNRSTTFKVVATTIAAITGNVAGKLSFIPVISQRIVSDLPESSKLRQKVMEASAAASGNALTVLSQLGDSGKDDHSVQFDTGSDYDPKEYEPQSETQQSAPKKYITYEELRKKHRGDDLKPVVQGYTGLENLNIGYQAAPESLEASTPTEATQPAEELAPQKRVRYNKYGDPIVE